ncbi:hypothetical protein BT69DRAFT_1340321 [Atractiella rhizophila]|nr:hypothetical protein BT69DRAFT_1340321 [Atractiella rhizophila]
MRIPFLLSTPTLRFVQNSVRTVHSSPFLASKRIFSLRQRVENAKKRQKGLQPGQRRPSPSTLPQKRHANIPRSTSYSLANIPPDSLEGRLAYHLKQHNIPPSTVLFSSLLPVSQPERNETLQAWVDAAEAPDFLGTLDALQLVERWETFESKPDDPFSYHPTIADESPIPLPDNLLRIIPHKLRTRYEGTLAIGVLASPVWLQMSPVNRFEFLISTIKSLANVGHWHGVREIMRYHLFFTPPDMRRKSGQYHRVLVAAQNSNLPLDAWLEMLPLYFEAMDRSNCSPNSLTFRILFQYRQANSNVMKMLLEEMERRGITATEHIVRSSLVVYSKEGKTAESAKCLRLLPGRLVGDLQEVLALEEAGEDPVNIWIDEGRTVTRDHVWYLASFYHDPDDGERYFDFLESFLHAKGRFDIPENLKVSWPKLEISGEDVLETRTLGWAWRVRVDLATKQSYDYKSFIRIFRELKGKYQAMREAGGANADTLGFTESGDRNIVQNGLTGLRVKAPGSSENRQNIVQGFLIDILEKDPSFKIDANMLTTLVIMYNQVGKTELANEFVETLAQPVASESNDVDEEEPIPLPPVEGLAIQTLGDFDSSFGGNKLLNLLTVRCYKSIKITHNVVNNLMWGYRHDWNNAYRLWSTMERTWGVIPNHVSFVHLLHASINASPSSNRFISGFDGSLPDSIATHKRNSEPRQAAQEFAHPTQFVADIFWRALYLNYPHLVQTIILPTSKKPLDFLITEYVKKERADGIPRNVWTAEGVARPLPSLSSAHPSEYPHITFNNMVFRSVIRLFRVTRSEDNIPLLLTWMRAIELDVQTTTMVQALSAWQNSGKAGKVEIWAMWRWVVDWLGQEKTDVLKRQLARKIGKDAAKQNTFHA